MKRTILVLFCSFLIFSCDLFNNPTDSHYLDKLHKEIAYANAPWVPLQVVVPADLGTANIPPGRQLQTVKLGYSFKLVFVPAQDVPFQGWDALVAGERWSSWRKDSGTNKPDIVNFIPLNDEGTEVEIFVYKMPPTGDLSIGPVGASVGTITNIQPSVGQPPLGIIFPARLGSIRPGYAFTMSFQPSASYPFRGWQIRSGLSANSIVYSTWTIDEEDGITVNNENYDWKISWEKRNASGTDISLTIGELPEGLSKENIIIGPFGMDSPVAAVTVSSGGLGTITSSITDTSPARQGYSFSVSYQPHSQYPFVGKRT